jgi:hypothetical protein
MRGGLFVAALAIVLAAAKLAAVAADRATQLAAVGFAMLGFSFIGIITIALRHLVRELYAANSEAADYIERRRAVRRVMRVWKKRQVHWNDSDNAARGHFDAAVESLMQSGQLAAARGLAVEKLHVAHSSGERETERMYRRYVKVLDRLAAAAA